MYRQFALFIFALFLAPLCWAQVGERINRGQSPTTVIGPRNIPLYDGAQALLAGENEKGVALTHQGLEIAQGRREEEAALSNLCAGYIKLGKYQEALKYCDILLARNDKNWRGYNNRAVIYIQTKQWNKAEQDLIKGEELNPGASTMKVARSMYMDAVHPVRPEIEIDDRQNENTGDPQQP
ncbi:MAG: hypothetical protein O3A13_12565 [Proteobacteria bacterium]|jgi:tetratricopeptide (TPR) repeat protein|nr:hypothetical protein [Pseudomonadota bacterium]MDA0994447.1 hypothetical protein [Pseudomonadota bacterium]